MIGFCAVCFGDPSSPLTKGLNAGIFVLMVFLLAVLASFARLFLNIRNRTRMVRRA